jgi:hypothetical protein
VPSKHAPVGFLLFCSICSQEQRWASTSSDFRRGSASSPSTPPSPAVFPVFGGLVRPCSLQSARRPVPRHLFFFLFLADFFCVDLFVAGISRSGTFQAGAPLVPVSRRSTRRVFLLARRTLAQFQSFVHDFCQAYFGSSLGSPGCFLVRSCCRRRLFRFSSSCSATHMLWLPSLICVWISVWIVAGTYFGYTLELPDRKARGFLVLIAFKRLFFEHAHKLLGEISVRTQTEFCSDFCRQSRTCSCQHRLVFPLCFLTRFRGSIAVS